MQRIGQWFKGRRWVRVVCWPVAALLLVWVALCAVLPGIIAKQIEVQASQVLGRVVTVRDVEVAPWSLALTVHGLEVAGLPGQAPMLSVERIYINASVSSVWRWGPVLDALELDQPVLRLRQEASGVWDFADVWQRLQADKVPDAQGDPLRMALYNIQLRDGHLELEDRVSGGLHRVDDVQLQLPFLSTLASQRAIRVQPRLSMRVNGSEITTQAVGTPFDTQRRAQVQLHIRQLDLRPFAAYVPVDVPLRLQQGVLDAALVVAFEQMDGPTVQLQGSELRLSQVQLQDQGAQPVAAWQQLHIVLGDARPLQGQLRVAAVTLQQPWVRLHRRENGQWLAASTPASASLPGAEGAGHTPHEGMAWQLLLDHVAVQQGQVQWQDDMDQVQASIGLVQLNAQVQRLTWPMREAAQWSWSAQLQGGDRTSQGWVTGSGQGQPDAGQASLVVHALDVQIAQAYARKWLTLPVQGQLSLHAGMAWKQGRVHARVPSLAIRAAALGDGKAPDLGWKNVQLRDLVLDSATREMEIAHVDVEAPVVRLQRNAHGQWRHAQWLQSTKAPVTRGAAPDEAGPALPWQLRVQTVQVSGGQVELTDAALGTHPLAVKLSDLALQLQQFDSRKASAQAALSLRMAERTRRGTWGRPGTVAYEGVVQLQPLSTQGRLRLQALPLQAFEPLVAPYLNVRLVRALAHWDGTVSYAHTARGPQLMLQGQAGIADAHVQSLLGDTLAAQAVQGPQAGVVLGAEDLLRWKQLRLQGLRVQLKPAHPPYIQVRNTELQDFYARVVVLPEGRLNLQNLVRERDVHVPEEQAVAPAPAPRIEMGPMVLRGGIIKFSDYFIRPNYTADVTGLAGSLAAFASQAAVGVEPALAALHLEGVVQGSAQLNVEGALNPLAQPWSMDVQARVQGLDLPPLTPYAVKYAGHGIERGKLSMDVHYQVLPDGQLTASNQLMLDQLTFSDPVEGAPASLPVRLAVALLADSNGVIDLNLPLSGSLNDPEFRIAPLVFKIIGNILRKAVTAPLSLLMGSFASDDAQSDIRFAHGQAILDVQAQQVLQQLAQTLNNKPQLRLTLQGQADSEAELQGYKQAQIARWVQGQDEEEGAPVRSERQRLAALKKLYRDVVKDRPRNLLGLTKEVPAEEMEALIVQAMEVPAAAWPALAAARAQNVRQFLVEHGVDAQRVFLGSTPEVGQKPVSPAVLLNISVQ